MSDEERGVGAGTVFLSFLAGAVVGAGLALLYAPKTGEELRGQITDLADDAIDKIKEITRDAQDKIVSTFEEGKETIMEKKTILSSALQAGKEAMERERERIKEA